MSRDKNAIPLKVAKSAVFFILSTLDILHFKNTEFIFKSYIKLEFIYREGK
jgi:hypothetical protein